MGRYQLNDVLLILRDLLGDKLQLWGSTRSAATYQPLLRASLEALEALPRRLERPREVDLKKINASYDRKARAIRRLLEAYEEHDRTSFKTLAMAQMVRNVFVPSRAEALMPYADKAARALKRAERLEELSFALEMFPVEGGSLYDWVKEFLEQGALLEKGLREQADADVPEGTHFVALRSFTQVVGQLNRLRQALADEVAANPELPGNLVQTVFSYADELRARRSHGGKREAEADPLDNLA